jgi:hypothetical protein
MGQEVWLMAISISGSGAGVVEDMILGGTEAVVRLEREDSA